MSDRIIFGVGATKAGTSWLWECLASHPDVSARAVKELHYFDTDALADQERQLAGFARVRARLEANNAAPRRVADLDALCDVIAGDRAGDAAYRAFVEGDGVALDVTPSYGLLPVAGFQRMIAAFAAARFIYLVRDPVERLWSHIRMEVSRRMKPGGNFDGRARAMLLRIMDEAGEPQVTVRGDYADALSRLGAAVPSDRLTVLVSEEMTAESICRAAGLAPHPAAKDRAHEGRPAEMRDALRTRAARFLKDQYLFMAEYLGRIPAAWRANYERAIA